MGSGFRFQDIVGGLKRAGRDGKGPQIMFDGLVLQRAQLLPKEVFLRMLSREQKRAERFRRPFLLMRLESNSIFRNGDVSTVGAAVALAIRETDVSGWLEVGSAMGVIFAELGAANPTVAANVIECKLMASLRESLSAEVLNCVSISFVECWGNSADEGLVPAAAASLAETGPTNQVAPPQRGTFPGRAQEVLYAAGHRLGLGMAPARGCECSRCKAARLAV